MLSNVPHSNFYFESNTERGCIDQLYIELGQYSNERENKNNVARVRSMVTGNPRSREKTRKSRLQGMGGLRF